MANLFWLCIGTILYVYAGYPALLTLLARLSPPKPVGYTSQLPTVTLLIAAYNEAAVIAQKLENSLALNYPSERLQILVTADGSKDDTPAIVNQFSERGVELCYEPQRRGKMAAINRAIPYVRGQIVIFSDANNLYDGDALQHLVAPFADPHVGAVSGAKVILKGDGALGNSEGLYWKYESYIKKQETHLGSCTGVAGEIFAIRRELFEAPPDQIINDDFYMAMRLIRCGHRVVYAPQARSYERVSLTAQDEVARRARIVAGRYQAMSLAGELLPWQQPFITWQIISHKYSRPLLPLAMIGALLANMWVVVRPDKGQSLRRLATPFNWLALIGQLIFYGAAWLGGRQKNGKIGKLLYIPYFLVNSNMAALIGLYRFFTGKQTTLWQRVSRRQDDS